MPKRTGGTCILVDNSYSMSSRTRELGAVMEDLRKKCGVTEVEMPTSVPDGSTALADSAHKFAKGLKTATFLVVTDGDDTSSKKHFNFPKPASYKKTWKVHNGRRYPSQRWLNAKREAVLDFLEKTLKAKIVLLGMGDGAKKLIRAASRKGRRINCAYIADGDANVDITKIMDAACDEAARKDGKTKTRVITSKTVNDEGDDEYWGEEDGDLDGFLDDDEEAVASEDEEDEDKDEDEDEDEEDSDDSDDLCDDDSDDSDDDDAPSKGKKRAAPASAPSNRSKRAATSSAYVEDSEEEEEEEEESDEE